MVEGGMSVGCSEVGDGDFIFGGGEGEEAQRLKVDG